MQLGGGKPLLTGLNKAAGGNQEGAPNASQGRSSRLASSLGSRSTASHVNGMGAQEPASGEEGAEAIGSWCSSKLMVSNTSGSFNPVVALPGWVSLETIANQMSQRCMILPAFSLQDLLGPVNLRKWVPCHKNTNKNQS